MGEEGAIDCALGGRMRGGSLTRPPADFTISDEDMGWDGKDGNALNLFLCDAAV